MVVSDLRGPSPFYRDPRYGMASFAFLTDKGHQLAFMGFDAFHVALEHDDDEDVMLNKRALFVDARSLPEGEWGKHILSSRPRIFDSKHDEGDIGEPAPPPTGRDGRLASRGATRRRAMFRQLHAMLGDM